MSRLGPLREREFRLLFAGRTISMAGSAMAPVALAFAVLNTLHGSATDLGLVLAARQVPTVLFLLFGGVILTIGATLPVLLSRDVRTLERRLVPQDVPA